MTPVLSSVAILGPGLLGGSLALALERAGCSSISLWGRSEKAVAEAQRHGVSGATCSLEDAVVDVDVIILCTPVGAMPELVRDIVKLRAGKRVLISDVGSVKRMPAALIRPLISGSGHRFIGGHPMAGSEQKGMAAATADLFENATTVLTPHPSESAADIEILTALWTATGAECHIMSLDDHDSAVGRFSHYPHVMASLCADIALAHPEASFVSGNGLRDTTRVASGDASMWTEILMENSDAITGPLEETVNQLRDVLASLKRKDHDQLQTFLQRAKDKRDQLPPASS